ncbi:carboxypeptidase-like regulatory domain-containing protein [Pseudothermotoga sp.]
MKRVMVHLVMVSVLFLLFSCMGTTPANYTIDGTVKLWDGTPLAGVTIIAGQATTTTDESGNWRIEGLTGTVVVKAEKDGYYIVVDGTNYYTSIEASNERTINFTAYSETEEFGGGNGTQENPYIIVNVQQLLNMANHVPDSPDSTPLYFTQIRDIDLNDALVLRDISSDPQPNWTPLGRSNQPYICVYNGSDFSIKNMVVVDNGSLSNGFFHALEKSIIKNVVFENATVVATKTFTVAGILAGSIYSGCTIENVAVRNCRVIVRVANPDAIGGLAGETYDSTITNCSVDGLTIEAEYDEDVGGFIGGFVGSAQDSSSFEKNLLRTTTIKGKFSTWTGGFVGEAKQSSFENCHLETLLMQDLRSIFGGFAAHSSYSSFVDCDVVEATLSASECQYAGGFVGYSQTNNFTNCTFKGRVEVETSNSPEAYIGGFAAFAYADKDNSSFESCKVLSGSSLILTADRAGTNYVFGLIGYGYGYGDNAKLILDNSYVRVKITRPDPNVHTIIYGPLGWLEGHVDNRRYDARLEE